MMRRILAVHYTMVLSDGLVFVVQRRSLASSLVMRPVERESSTNRIPMALQMALCVVFHDPRDGAFEPTFRPRSSRR